MNQLETSIQKLATRLWICCLISRATATRRSLSLHTTRAWRRAATGNCISKMGFCSDSVCAANCGLNCASNHLRFVANMKTNDATVLEEPKTRKRTTEETIEPAIESRPRRTTGVREAKIYIDGKFCSEVDAKVSVFDHGLLYGDGIFEGIRFYNGRVFRLEEHLERLWDSARSICLEIPMTRQEMTEAWIEANLAHADEALMLNDAGNVAECTADNVFIIKDSQIFTPPITAGALRGITRSVVFDIAGEFDLEVTEADFTRHDIFVADEC